MEIPTSIGKIPSLTVVGSVVQQLKAIRPRSVAVFTPYEEDLTLSVAQCVVEAGYELRKTAGMGILSNRDIGRVSPDEIVDFVETRIDDAEVDCIFLSCTNWQAIDAIARLEARFRLPVISSSQATIEAVRTQLSNFQSAHSVSAPAR